MYIPEIKEEINENDKMLIVGEDGKVYRVEVPENGASVWDDVKNKPFGEENVERVLIPEQEVVVEENWAYFTGDFYSITGLKVNVTFDGVDYVTEPIYEDGDAIYHAKFTTNDGLIVDITNDRYIDIDEPNGYKHTIKASITETKIKYLDNKYIKDMYGEEVVETVLVPEHEVMADYSGDLDMNTGYLGWLNTGSTYTVVYDGVIYTTEPCYMDGDAVYHAKFTTNSGMEIDIEDSGKLYAEETDGSIHTIKISIFETKLTMIDAKYLPIQPIMVNDYAKTRRDASKLRDAFNSGRTLLYKKDDKHTAMIIALAFDYSGAKLTLWYIDSGDENGSIYRDVWTVY